MFLIVLIETFVPIILVITVAGIIGFCVYYFNGKQVVLRTLSKIPLKPVGGLKTNQLTKINGKALHVKEPLIAPLSKRKCIFYHVILEKRLSTGKSSHWKTIVDEQKIQEFFIDSNGEFAIIKPTQSPQNFVSYLVKDRKASSGTFNDPSPEFESLLKRYNIDSTSFFGFNKSLRYREGVIEVGEQITVAGIAKWKSLDKSIAEYSYSKIAALESTEKQKLIITDLPEANTRRHR